MFDDCNLSQSPFDGRKPPEYAKKHVAYVSAWDLWKDTTPEFREGRLLSYLTKRFDRKAFLQRGLVPLTPKERKLCSLLYLKDKTLAVKSLQNSKFRLLSNYQVLLVLDEKSEVSASILGPLVQNMPSIMDHAGCNTLAVLKKFGEQWKVELRALRDDVDVSVLAKKMGGGGHKAAAGFTSDDLVWW